MSSASSLILVSVALLVLYALALRLCVSWIVVAPKTDNSVGRAFGVSLGLAVLSSVTAQLLPSIYLSSLVVLLGWGAVVRWAYKLEVTETVLVAVAMLLVCFGGIVLLDQLLAGFTS